METPSLLLVATLCLAGCGDAGRGNPNPTFWGDFATVPAATDDGGQMADNCSTAAKLVYVIDASGQLSSFAPDKLLFVDLGVVHCGSEPAGSVNSMAIDRNAIAWINFQSGNIYKVDVTSKTLDCQATAFKPNPVNGFTTFGMGYSANSNGSSDETLFIAGPNGLSGNALARLDTTTMKATAVGPLASWPELTGTGDAKLWGFFPANSGAKVAQIDKATAALGMTYNVPQLNGNQMAWAFAFWGGDFWIFLKRQKDASTNVWHVAIFDGGMNVTEAIPNTGREIVGAGVSTCAPVTIG
jgi:hypothetical protein